MKKKCLLIFLIFLMTIFLVLNCSACFLYTSVKLSGISSLKVKINEEIDLQLSASTSSDYTEEEILSNLIYTSSNEDVVRIDDGIIKSVNYGEAIVRVTWAENEKVYFESKIKVLPTSIENAKIIEPSTKNFFIGEKIELSVEYSCYYDTTVSWRTSDDKIASVNDGIVRALSVGSFSITAVFSNETQVVEVSMDFTVIERYFSINYELDGGINNSNNPNTYTEQSEIVLFEPTKEGYKFVGWYCDDELIETISATMSGDLTIVAKWDYIPKSFNITYELDGGTNNPNNPNTYTEQSEMTLYAPTKEGYKFVGWYCDDELIESISATMSGDLIIVARWKYIPKTYNITYELDDGTNNPNNPNTYTEQNEIVLYAPTKEGYNFIGWYCDDELIESISATMSGDLTIVAKWEYIPKSFNITYELDGGTNNPNNPNTYTEQSEIVFFEPTKEGYKFVGWYCDDELIETISATMSGDLTIVAKWEYIPKTYNISYELDGGTNNPNNPNSYIEQNETTLYAPTKEGYKFIGWYCDDELIETISATMSGDLTIVAKWEYIPKTYNISYELDGGTNNPNNPNSYTAQSEIVLYAPTKEGYKFIGWYCDDELIESISATMSGDLIIVARWKYIPKTYNITYELDGGTNNPNNPNTYTEQNEIVLYAPTKEGYNFIGWYCDDELIESISATMSGDLTIVAKWEYIPKTYNISYELDGGINNSSNPNSYTEQSETTLYVPTKEGHKFVGWYCDEELIESISATMSGNLTIVAKWEYIPKTYNITYELDGGTNNLNSPNTYTEQSETALYEPMKEGYKFIGWYCDDELIESISETMSGDLTIVAKWTALYVEVSYNLNGGEWFWTTDTVTDPSKGIDSVSNLPEVLMGDFYYYLKTNDLLQSSVVSPELSSNAYSWVDFSKNYSDPVALYNWTSTGSYNSCDGYSQLFYDTFDGINAIGGFFGTSPYKEKYDNLFKFIVQLTQIKYSGSNTAEKEFKSKLGFVLDGYLYGTQSLLTSGQNHEIFNAMRGLIPTPTLSYQGTTEIGNEYAISKSQFEINLVAPTREGYAFMGWYDNEEFIGEPITSVKVSTTVYAKWYELNATHLIIYELNGGINPDDSPNTYLEGVGIKVLPIPSKEGYIFLGWSEASASSIYLTEISKYDDKDYVLFANWEEILECRITYLYDEGHTPIIMPNSLEEFANIFWQEFYLWSNSSESIDDFKSSALSAWSDGIDGGYKVYKQSGRTIVDNNYFANAQGNDIWRAWLDVFDTQVTAINASQSAWGSTYVGYLRLYTFFKQSSDYWTKERTRIVYQGYRLSEKLVTSFKTNEIKNLVGLEVDDGRQFLGWYDENNQKVTTTEGLRNDVTLTAKWSEKPILFEITNIPERVLRFESYQLSWVFRQTSESSQKLKFKSSDTDVLSVDENGKIYGANYGYATITVTLSGNSDYSVSFDVLVYVEPFIDATYQESAIVEIGQTTKIDASIVSGTGTIRYHSNNPSIATIDENGVVLGIYRGYAEIELYLEENRNVNLKLGVTVVDSEMAKVFDIIRNAHNTEIYVTRDLNVAYVYYTDVFNSVSDLLFNYDYSVNNSLVIPVSTSQKETSRPGTKIGTMEFITVHYTAGTGKSFDARATANYFNSITSASANYCTGNDGIYMVIPDGEVAWHAGDGTSVKFSWKNTGVQALGNVKPVWGVEKNSTSSTGYYFTLNGVSTTIEVPVNGKTNSGNSATIKDPLNAFTFYGPAWKVVDGYYYMGTTWACFTQSTSGYIASRGGNLNSVGIETACNNGSDLWLTYQITAQLVARLLVKYNLDTTRVVGHNMFTGKDCPQTLLANDGELWYKFMECVESEYALYKLNDEYSITCKSNNTDIVDSNGRILKIPDQTTTVSYTVTVTNKSTGQSKSETYSTVVHGRLTE